MRHDDCAGRPGSGGAPSTMHVVLRIDRQVVLHDARHVVDVHAASGDIGGHQRLQPTSAEIVERLIAFDL